MVEKLLMRAFVLLHGSDYEGDSDRCPYMSGNSKSSEQRAFTVLSSVCSFWRQTLIGWPRSSAGRIILYNLKKLILIARKYTVFC